MAAAPLTSNHVNYLIWRADSQNCRYLQESGHDRTAARLQRDWKIGDPETLPFARHIKTHALVSLVQKGLQYHELEISLEKNGDRATQTPTALFFGTEVADAPKKDDDASSILRAPASPSKRSRESLVPGSALETSTSGPVFKRRRNAKDASARTPPVKSGDEMDVDQLAPNSGNESTNEAGGPTSRRQSYGALPNGKVEDADHEGAADAASTNAAEPAKAPTPVIPTSGPSVPTQTDAIVQISPEATKLIELGVGKRAFKTVWNPRQPNLLAAAGDGLCRIWSVPSGSGLTAASVSGNASANGASATDSSATGAPQHVELFENAGPGMENATITAIAWTPNGEYLAAARHPNDSNEASAVSVFDNAGVEITQLGKGQRFFFGLAFNPSGTLLLGHGGDNSHYADESRDYGLCVWNVADDSPDPMVSSSTASRQIVTGAVWLDDKTIIVCGPGYIATTIYENKTLQPLQELPPELSQDSTETGAWEWSFMEYDRYTSTCILADEYRGRLALLSADRKNLQTVQAHDDEIKGIQYQPLPQHGSSGDGPRLVVTASKDGSIKMWDVANNAIKPLRTFHCDSFRPGRHPALAMQFSPDGGTLAVATNSRVVFWRPEKSGTWPHAEWALERVKTGWRDGSPIIKNEKDIDVQVNGDSAVVNGTKGHSTSNGTNGTTASTGTDPVVNEADRMNVDTPDIKPPREELEEQEPPATITWSAMGKKIAYGNGEQIAIADYVNAGRV